MKRLSVLLAALLLMGPGLAQAQARGPSAQEVQEDGQDILSGRERRQIAFEEARQRIAKEQAPLDEATRQAMFAELDTWFRRLPGRFRIDGKLEMRGGPGVIRRRDIDGVADCKEIGEGIGLHCILNARWKTLIEDPPPIVSTGRIARKLPSEQLNTMQPSVLVLGMDLDHPGIRAMMVNANSVAHTWVGPLRDSTARANRLNRCLQSQCLQPLEIIAEPGSPDIAIIMYSGIYTITLTMIHDPDAQADKPIKGIRAH